MEVSEIIAVIDSIPTWVWVMGVIAILFASSDRIMWDYEVKFPLKEGAGRGKVELEGKKKKGPYIECNFELEKTYQNRTIDIFLNGHAIYQIPAEKNNTNRLRLSQPITLSQPKEGDMVSVHIGGEEIFTGQLVLD